MEHYVQNIEISNFKSIKDLTIDGCKKINIFAGKPNAGKSNILEALSLFDVFFNPQNLKYFVRYEKNNDLFFEGNSKKDIEVSINNNSKNGGYIEIISDRVEFLVDELKLKFNLIDSGISVEKFFSSKGIPALVNRQDNIIKNIINIKKFAYRESKILRIKQESKKYLESPFGENISEIIQYNREIRGFVNKFLSENDLKLLIERGTNDLKIFKEYEDGTVFSLPYSMIADTLQRLIFYKTAIMSNENSVLLFEEPEAHCFEPYILEITNEIKYNKNNNQFFIVTHSDFIIQEFLRDEESRNDVQIYLVNNEKGSTKVKGLKAEKNEDVYEYGMNVFFNFDDLWKNN